MTEAAADVTETGVTKTDVAERDKGPQAGLPDEGTKSAD